MSAHNITPSSTLSRFQIVGGRRTEDDDDNETFGSVRTPLSGRGQRIAPKLVSWCHAQSSFQSNVGMIKGNVVIFLVMECDSP